MLLLTALTAHMIYLYCLVNIELCISLCVLVAKMGIVLLS